MPAQAHLKMSLTVRDSAGEISTVLRNKEWRWTNTVDQRTTVSLTGSAFTAISVPTGAKAVIILPGSAVSLVLKGITGDSASITIAPASAPIGIPLVLPLGASPVLGILNSGSTVSVTVIFV